MKTNSLCAFIFGTFTLLCLARSANGQTYFPYDATIDYGIHDRAIVGQGHDNNGNFINTSPTVNVINYGIIYDGLYAYNNSTVNVSAKINGGGIGNGLYAYDSSTVNVSDGLIEGGLLTYNNSTTNVTGGSITGLYAYNNSTVNISSGNISGDVLSAYDASTVNVNGGNIYDGLNAYNSSTVNVRGGSIIGLFNYNSSTISVKGNSRVNFSGGTTNILEARNSSTTNVSGGTINDGLYAYDTSIVNFSGGAINGPLNANNTSTINLTGPNLNSILINPSFALGSGLYSEYVLFGNLRDGSSVNGKLMFVQNGIGSAKGAQFTINDLPPDNRMLLTLANLCKNVYTGIGGFGQFGFVGTNSDYVPSQKSNQGFKAVVYRNGDASQIVIAIRGTDTSDLLIAEKNILADLSWVNNIPDLNFITSVSYAAALVQAVHTALPDANVTLTGHSLGGGIAQLVGKAAGLTTVTFNAPGPRRFYSSLTTQLAPATQVKGTSSAIVDYRLKNEQVSLVGTQTGSTVTLADPDNTIFRGTNIGGTFEAVASLDTIYYLHLITTMIEQVAYHPQAVDATGELNAVPTFHGAALPSAPSKKPDGALVYAFGFAIADITTYLFDPSSGSDYILAANSGSPRFASLVLPAVGDVAAYSVRYQVGNTWTNYSILHPSVQYTLNQPAKAIEYLPLDAYGKSTVLPDGFYFGASFASTGNFSGTLTVSNTQATVTGQIMLDSVADQSLIRQSVGDITFEFRAPSTTSALFTKIATLTTDAANPALGDYTLNGVTPGTYDIAVKSRNGLRNVVKNVTTTGSAGTIPSVLLLGGDADNNNVVDIGDFGLLINAYAGDMSVPNSGYDPAADFNYDGVVDISDFGLLVNNYGFVGDL